MRALRGQLRTHLLEVADAVEESAARVPIKAGRKCTGEARRLPLLAGRPELGTWGAGASRVRTAAAAPAVPEPATT